jgi:hypothetical protein
MTRFAAADRGSSGSLASGAVEVDLLSPADVPSPQFSFASLPYLMTPMPYSPSQHYFPIMIDCMSYSEEVHDWRCIPLEGCVFIFLIVPNGNVFVSSRKQTHNTHTHIHAHTFTYAYTYTHIHTPHTNGIHGFGCVSSIQQTAALVGWVGYTKE